MLGHTASLWQYLGSFVGYTLFSIGLIYAAYWFLRKQPNWLTGTAFQKNTTTTVAPKSLLEVEANLALEPRKTLYIVRAGHERFLISTTLEQTQCLAKLTEEDEDSPAPVMSELKPEKVEERVTLPWFAKEEQPESPRPNATKPGFGARLVQSMQWLIETRK